MNQDQFATAVREELRAVEEMLLQKNAAYGDSALSPLRIFSSASTTEQLRVRLDDKLSRLSRGTASGEDTVKDALGYLVLLRISERRDRANVENVRSIPGRGPVATRPSGAGAPGSAQ